MAQLRITAAELTLIRSALRAEIAYSNQKVREECAKFGLPLAEANRLPLCVAYMTNNEKREALLNKLSA